MKCDCNAWKENIDHLDDLVIMGYLHGMISPNMAFKYCPWCGKKLKKDNTKWYIGGDLHGTIGEVENKDNQNRNTK